MTKVKTISLPDDIADEIDLKAKTCGMPVSTYITNIFRLVFGKPVVATEVKADDIQKPEVEDFKALTHLRIKEDAYMAYKKAKEAGESFLFETWCVDVPRVRGVRPINKQELEAYFSTHSPPYINSP